MYKEFTKYVRSSLKRPQLDLKSMATKGHDQVTFNVGGVTFKTLKNTLENEDTRLSEEDFLQDFYDENTKEYFFDRDPNMFLATLNYLRTGELHLPSFICGPAAKVELEFWGVHQSKIEQCCWINYNEWNSTQDALKRLEHDRKLNMLPLDHLEDPDETCWNKLRPRVWRFLNRTNSSKGARIFGYISLLFVVVSIFSFLAETTEPFEHYTSHKQNSKGVKNADIASEKVTTTYATVNLTSNASETIAGEKDSDDVLIKIKHPALQVIDMICLLFFLIEYIIRLIFSPKKLKYVTSLLAVIDLLAILPDMLETILYFAKPELRMEVDAVGYITLIRVVRVLRIFRLVRHSAGLWILIYTLRASVSELMLLVWFMLLGILVFSSLIYYVDDREVFNSIPTGFWWALITMTTVGYGDMYPTTTLGKLVGSVCAMAGVLMIGFTVPSLVNNFMLYYRHTQFAMHVDEFEKEKKRKLKEAKQKKEKNDKVNGNFEMRVIQKEHEVEPLMAS
ncbi:potassium voltage-gated channel subfamily C member 3-like isoform X2 [Mya arenaria]|uniref:potassium voltage-gated channel subfamily C member 3-like isoform X2 n=1 Tax=Mya arenaria TaxID=6604 RepID=UPI0022E72B8B|nr:potassium voltage-gated channel subfamily C member 3-like isoform X2 [Mya arenaria]